MSVTYDEMAKNLKKVAEETNAREIHITRENIQGDNDLTIVMSAYKGIKPAHIVLNELYEWAERNNLEVARMIRGIEGTEE